MAATSLINDSNRNAVIGVIYNNHCTDKIQGLTPEELQQAYEGIRPDGLNIKQIEASLRTVCESERCDKEDLIDVLKEMDRRYFLVNDLKWEFALLDRSKKGAISEQDAKFLFKMIHGEFFSTRRWNKFLSSRPAKVSLISFSEIEVDLCEIPTVGWIEEILEEEEEERRAREVEREEEARARLRAEQEKTREEEEIRKKQELEQKNREEAKLKKEEDRKRNRQMEEDEKRQKLEEKQEAEAAEIAEQERKQKEEEKRKAAEEKKRLEEERKRLAEEEEQRKQEALVNWKKAELLAKKEAEKERLKEINAAKQRKLQQESENAEDIAEDAAAEEERLKEAARIAGEEAKKATNAESKRRAEEAEKKALAEARANKEKKLRMQLKASVNSRKTERIRGSIKDAKAAKMPTLQPDIDDAEKVIDNVEAGEKLIDAMSRRHLGDVEAAVSNIKKRKLEKEYAVELIDADKLMNKLRRLERLRKEILELNSSTISEIRSYQNPPPAVHQVMIAVYLLLGYKEKELKIWKNMQAFLGRTGKEGLKRQVTTLEPSKVNINIANYTDKSYLSKHDLDTIRDVSAGAATFFVWCTSMIEETKAWKEEEEKRKILEAAKKKEEEAEKKKEEERKKAREERRKLGLTVEDAPSRNASVEDVRAAAATGIIDALKPAASKQPTTSKPPPSLAKGKTPTPSQPKTQTPRGRAPARADPKQDRSKSQPAKKVSTGSNAGRRSGTPGRK